MKIDVVAFGAHPDDVELSCSGTLMAQKAMGYSIAIVDLTRGELGTRGSVELRAEEAAKASEIMGLDARLNLGLKDGFIDKSEENKLAVIRAIRFLKPSIILCNAISDRHPDHGNAASLVKEAAFLAGLKMIETFDEAGLKQEAWRPRLILHYLQSDLMRPDIIMDISGFMDKKLEAIKAYGSQFYNPETDANAPATFISTPEFWESITARSSEMGHNIGVQYGEGFVSGSGLMGVSDLNCLLQ